mgnify:CR=1 FL=1
MKRWDMYEQKLEHIRGQVVDGGVASIAAFHQIGMRLYYTTEHLNRCDYDRDKGTCDSSSSIGSSGETSTPPTPSTSV